MITRTFAFCICAIVAVTEVGIAKPAAVSMDFWKAEGEQAEKIPPTLANVPYGKDPMQVMDFWKAESATPTPLVFFIHGGGWNANDKNKVAGLRKYLPAGISVVSINYRFVRQADAAGIKPPVKWALEDAARALQFVRSKAGEWNIDKTRIGASGGSAGACSSLWLAFHDDMANPESTDPIARESTRLSCAGLVGAQTSLDPEQMKEWIPNITYGGHAFGFNASKKAPDAGFNKFLANRDKIMQWIKEYSPYELLSPDDPPVFLHYNNAAAVGKKQSNPTHGSNFGVKLQEKMKENGVECQLLYLGSPEPEFADPVDFLIARLRDAKAEN